MVKGDIVLVTGAGSGIGLEISKAFAEAGAKVVITDVIYPLVPQKRLLAVEEIADYALFLASRKAKGITGQANVLDGGYTIQ
ncbi:SDR family oxidoreductase [Exiguobacterium antarcticum]|uniref:SDR family oxidoreductase n=1 Tax=Exiguobacterium antarcticum TaxID=132920 RepID=A0ABT6R1Y8_9BACL|nr:MULTISPECIES: SDR family oxidoreductase [Exiguobacterium]MCT4779770.1 SDR family oxidoreductase [Exiguobacterium soli]MDI3234299.1 SDR family oxidoreductase [Exiguobacterium antarcticum]